MRIRIGRRRRDTGRKASVKGIQRPFRGDFPGIDQLIHILKKHFGRHATQIRRQIVIDLHGELRCSVGHTKPSPISTVKLRL